MKTSPLALCPTDTSNLIYHYFDMTYLSKNNRVTKAGMFQFNLNISAIHFITILDEFFNTGQVIYGLHCALYVKTNGLSQINYTEMDEVKVTFSEFLAANAPIKSW